jgi:DNA polymerase
VRGALVAEDGKKLVIADLSNIEGRVLAWLANEKWKIDAFADFDKGIGHDLYKLAYARAFNLPVEKISKDDRQLGKVMELALGYQGGLGAFNTMASAYGVSLPDERVQELVTAWRKAHPAVRSFWYALEGACNGALLDEGKIHKVGLLSAIFKDTWLRIKLPSGRWLCYPNAAMESGRIVYDGTNQFTKKWERIETYGGKICENIVQAVARDVLASGLLRAETAGYRVCLHVHDEIIAEVPDIDEYSADGLSAIMSHNPGWTLGLPLAAAGFETLRYRKD